MKRCPPSTRHWEQSRYKSEQTTKLEAFQRFNKNVHFTKLPENHLGNDSCLKLGNFIIVGHPDWENVTIGGQMQIRCGEFVAKPEFVYKHLGANNLLPNKRRS